MYEESTGISHPASVVVTVKENRFPASFLYAVFMLVGLPAALFVI